MSCSTSASQTFGSTFDLTVDLFTEWSGLGLTEEAVRLWESLLAALCVAGRVSAFTSGPALLYVNGIRTPREGQVLGGIAMELHAWNHDGAQGCLTALTELGFVPAISDAPGSA